MSPPPDVSVVVVSWNRRDLLRACLASLHAQTLVAHEVIVVDNGSLDGSAEMVAAEFPSCRVIRNSDNRGFCAANNQGIAVAQGRVVALLNNDAEADPRWLEELVTAFAGDATDVGMAASKILRWDRRDVIDKVGHLIYPDGQNRGRGAGQTDRGQFDAIDETAWPDGAAAAYRKSMLDEIGGFDEDFFAYADDAELGLRARIAGWRCLYVPTAVVHHHRGATLGRDSPERLFLIERNRTWLAAKLFPWRLLAQNPLYLALRIGAGMGAAALGRGEAGRAGRAQTALQMGATFLRANLAAAAGLPRMLRKRREIDHIRRLDDQQVCALLRRFRIGLRELTLEGA